ncbi:hypothetical protein [Acinetobacter gerneri]|uniref:Uncharacterized protein n=1 Tax=Acinetobacter gerneri DSM 14967 = CIP 107464 = MTCC 9824 TaxID=1120926 RepID=N8ZQY7_9GAMM|nr:hypothetical protein [Acinetobacter gerneri]ENV33920.1 hypothetical protein F960_01926 [Acinetobacter gerneri DSM 14967 = CIP 107464 = MTCC 9824]EPR82797.1 hypothetical protein L289_2715 [Acinetobacter gerneri DSM 14967 = CIP 107464 = MTCC 9824]
MGIQIISNNTVFNQSNGFSPSFDTTGLVYCNIYGVNDIAQNWAENQKNATKIGSIANDSDGYLVSKGAMTATLLTDTIDDSYDLTEIIVLKKFTSTTISMILSSWIETSASSRALEVPANTSEIRVFTPYIDEKFAYTNTLHLQDGANLIVIRHSQAKVTLTNLSTNESVSFTHTGTPKLNSKSFSIGSSAYGGETDKTTEKKIAAAMIFKRVLSDSDLTDVKSYLVDCLPSNIKI